MVIRQMHYREWVVELVYFKLAECRNKYWTSLYKGGLEQRRWASKRNPTIFYLAAYIHIIYLMQKKTSKKNNPSMNAV
jgi:hypothetical protein